MNFGLDRVKTLHDLPDHYQAAHKVSKKKVRDIVLDLMPKSLFSAKTYDELASLGNISYDQVRSATKQLLKHNVNVKSVKTHNHASGRSQMHYWVES